MEMPKTREGRRKLIKKLASSGKPEDIRPGTGKIPDEFWTMPLPEDPEGMMLKDLARVPKRRPLAFLEVLG